MTAKQSMKHVMTASQCALFPQNSSLKHYKRKVAFTLAFLFHYRIFCTTEQYQRVKRLDRKLPLQPAANIANFYNDFVCVCVSEGMKPRLQEINSSENQNLSGKESYLVKLFCSLLVFFVE